MSQQILQWFESNSAKRYLIAERQSVEKIASNICGQVGMQLTFSPGYDYLADLNLIDKLYQPVNSGIGVESVGAENRVSLEELPFESNHFSVVFVPCLSMYKGDIHAAMREIYRVTAPEGSIVVTGVNPLSVMGGQAKLYPKRYPILPSVGLSQMKSWLSLLGCKIMSGDLFYYHHLSNKPLTTELIAADKLDKIGNRWFPVLAGGYSLVAKKCVFSGTLNTEMRKRKRKNGKMVNSVAKKY